MELRHYIGIFIIAIGTTLIPIGWMFSSTVTVIGFTLFLLGLVIFMTQSYIKKVEDAEFRRYSKGGSAMPADIHDNSGWGNGGRSEGWSSPDSGSD